MTDLQVPFKVKLADPSRTFFDPATQLFIAQDQVGTVEIISQLIRDSIHAGGLVHFTGEETPVIPLGSSTQEGTEETSDESLGVDEEEEDEGTTEEQQSDDQEEGEEEETPETPETPVKPKELSLDDIRQLSKKKGK